MALTAGLVVAACGPSLMVQKESDLHFEHCYRLDLDRRVTASHRLHCWREWQRFYADGQPKDRRHHARERVSALAAGHTAASALAVAPAPSSSGEGASLMPSDPHRAPAAVVPVGAATASVLPSASAAPALGASASASSEVPAAPRR